MVHNSFVSVNLPVVVADIVTEFELYSSVGAAEYTGCIAVEGQDSPNECHENATKQSDAEYSFITITLRSTLVRSGSIC